jgi:transposase InsO family protein
MKDSIESNIETFLQECILLRFGYPRERVMDQGPQFTSRLVEEIMREHNIRHKKSTPYHIQENGKGEVTNIEL